MSYSITCPHCAEEIKPQVKVCPHCHRKINPTSPWLIGLPFGIFFAFLALIGQVNAEPDTNTNDILFHCLFNIIFYTAIAAGLTVFIRKLRS